MKILWISNMAWLGKEGYRLPVNGPGAVSGSLFQQSIIEGLGLQGVSVEILSDYPIANKKFNTGFNWSHNGKSKNKTVFSINIPLISLLVKTLTICMNTLKKQNVTSYNFAIAYLIHSPYLMALWVAKKVNRNLKTVLICPDLPGFMDMSLKEKRLKSILKKIDYKLIKKLLKNIDAYVIFSNCMRDELPIDDKASIVIEGVYSSFDLDLSTLEKKRAIMHAGTLHKNIGIENIIEAFKLINVNDLELWIFGDGDLKEYIRSAAKEDKRIRYFGFVSRSKLFEYQKQAMLLINARNPNDEYTKYSFPSKTFEYMVSGTPFLTTKLKGIPEEYYQYLYTIKNNDAIEIANSIKTILEIPQKDHEYFGLRARDFVLKNKNKNFQSLKLKQFLDSL